MRETHRRLLAQGHHIHVLAPAWRGLCSHEIDGIPVTRFRYAPVAWEILTHDEGAPSKMAGRPWLQLLAIPYILSGFWHARKLARSHKFDLVWAHWPFPHGLCALGARLAGVRSLILNFHGAELLLARRHFWVNGVFRWLLHRCTGVICNSSFTAGKVEALGGHPVIVPYGTTLNEGIEGANDSCRPLRLLVVGRQIERKGISYLIEAMEKLSPGDFELVLVGEGDRSAELRTQARHLAHVLFRGKVSSQQLREEYASAHVFVLPAIVDSKGDTEGLGVVLIEAAEYGLNLVASAVGGIPDVVVDGESGLLVPPASPDALVQALQRLAGDPELRARLRNGARRRVAEKFSWDVVIPALETVFVQGQGPQATQGREAGDRK